MIEFDLKIWLDQENQIVRKVNAENELVKYMLIHLFSRPYRRNFKPKEGEEWKQRIKVFVASTGDGKTFSFQEAVALYISILGAEQFMAEETPLIAFASSVKATIPVRWDRKSGDEPDSMMKAWTQEGLLTPKQYERCVLVYRSALDNLEINLNDVWGELASCSVLPRHDIQEFLHAYKAWVPESKRDNPDVEKRLRDADSALRRAIHRYILQGLPGNKKNVPTGMDCLRFIREKANGISFVEKLYPEVCLPEKKVVFLTTSKAFSICSPIVYQPGAFFNLPCCCGGVIFIDESDQAYGVLRESILDSLQRPYDYIVMFYSLARAFMNSGFEVFDSFLSATLEGSVPNSSEVIKLRRMYDGYGDEPGLRKQVVEFYYKYNFACGNFVSAESKEEHDRKIGFFLYNSFFRVGVVGKNGPLFPFVDVEKSCVSLGYTSDGKPESDRDFYHFLSRMKSLVVSSLYFLSRLSCEIAKITTSNDNEGIRSSMRKLLFRVLPSEETFGDRQQGGMTLHERMLSDLSTMGRRIGVIPSFDSGRKQLDTELASTGFDFVLSAYPYRDVDRIALMELNCNMTPESQLLAMSEKMDVLLVSASADFNCNIRNFNLRYLEKKIGSDLFQSPEEIEEIVRCHDLKMEGSSGISVEVTPFGMNEDEYRKDCRERWANLLQLQSESHKSILGKILKKSSLSDLVAYGVDIFLPEPGLKDEEAGERIFKSIRLFNLVEFIVAFVRRYNEGICPFGVYYLNIVIKEGSDDDSSPEHIISFRNLLKVVDFYLERHPIAYLADGRKFKAKDFIFVADSKRIEEIKNKVQDNLNQRMPALILTSSASAAVGQNFQMFIAPEYVDKTVSVGDRHGAVREDGFFCANIAMLGMECPTHILFDSDFGDTPEKRLRTASEAIYDILSISDAGEVRPTLRDMLIRAVLDRCGRFGSEYWREVPDEESDTRSLSGLVRCLRRTDAEAAAETVVVFQETGRFNREPVKFLREFIHLERRTRLVKAWRDDRLLTYEFSRLMSAWTNEEVKRQPEWSIQALDFDFRASNIIRMLVWNLRWSEDFNVQYENLKHDIIKGLFLDEDAYANEVNKVFWLNIGGRDGYYVWYFDRNSMSDEEIEDVAVFNDVQCKDICLDPPPDPKGKGTSPYRRIDVAATGLEDMLKVDGFAAFLDGKGVPYDWSSHGPYMLCPYAITLYVGTLGEYFAEHVLGQKDIVLERFGEDEREKNLFELFDYRFAGSNVLLDVKHWSGLLREDRTRDYYMAKVMRKAVTCKVDKVVFVNCFGSGTGSMERTYVLEDGRILHVLEVDGLARRNGSVLECNIETIFRFVYGI